MTKEVGSASTTSMTIDKLKSLLAFVEEKNKQADKELDQSFENDAIAALQYTIDTLEYVAEKLSELIHELE